MVNKPLTTEKDKYVKFLRQKHIYLSPLLKVHVHWRCLLQNCPEIMPAAAAGNMQIGALTFCSD
jgi:hypothetical protein